MDPRTRTLWTAIRRALLLMASAIEDYLRTTAKQENP
jgi:hypothetical protein